MLKNFFQRSAALALIVFMTFTLSAHAEDGEHFHIAEEFNSEYDSPEWVNYITPMEISREIGPIRLDIREMYMDASEAYITTDCTLLTNDGEMVEWDGMEQRLEKLRSKRQGKGITYYVCISASWDGISQEAWSTFFLNDNKTMRTIASLYGHEYIRIPFPYIREDNPEKEIELTVLILKDCDGKEVEKIEETIHIPYIPTPTIDYCNFSYEYILPEYNLNVGTFTIGLTPRALEIWNVPNYRLENSDTYRYFPFFYRLDNNTRLGAPMTYDTVPEKIALYICYQVDPSKSIYASQNAIVKYYAEFERIGNEYKLVFEVKK